MVALTQDETRRLLAQARTASQRDWLMILVAFTHGLRASEICGLRASSIKDGMLTVRRLKRSEKTTHPLRAELDPLFDERAPLLELARKCRKGARLFPTSRYTFWRRVKRYALAAGIPAMKAHPHALKHSIASQRIRTAGIHAVKKYLGHRRIASTEQYLKLDDAEAARLMFEEPGGGLQRRLIE